MTPPSTNITRNVTRMSGRLADRIVASFERAACSRLL